MSALDILGRTGINVTRDGSDDLAYVASLEMDYIRIPVTIADAGPPNVKYDLRPYLQQARSLGLRVLLLLDRDAFYWPDWSQNTAAYVNHWMTYYAGMFDAFEVGNEWDHKSPSSWDLPPDEFTNLLRAVRDATGPALFLVSGGMADGQPSAATAVDFSPVNAFGIHPYLKDAPNLDDVEDVPDVDSLLNEYLSVIPGKEAVITEWGWPGEWGEDRQAEESAEMVIWGSTSKVSLCLFNLRDSGETFGLLRQDYSAKPAFAAVRNAKHNLAPMTDLPVIIPPDHPDTGGDPGTAIEPATDHRPYRYWSSEDMSFILDVPIANIELLWPKLVEQMLLCGIDDEDSWIAMASTVRIETGGPTRALRFTCVREAYWMTEEWRQANLWYYPDYGRGPIQCTLPENYQSFAQKIDNLWQAGGAIVNMVAADRDAMLDPDIGSAFSATYFRDHGGDMQYLICVAARNHNWTEVRRLVQGGSAGLPDLIQYATAFLALSAPPIVVPGVDYSIYRFPVRGYTGSIELHWGAESGGSDIFGPRGTDIVAIADGIIDYRAEWDALGGNAVQLQHTNGDGLESYYAHGDKAPLVAHGQAVKAGDLLFGLGDTGNATAAGPHLHFGLGHGIVTGGGPTGGLGINFDAVTFLQGLQQYWLANTTPPMPALPCAKLISTVGYMGGDIARLLDAKLAKMSIPPLETSSKKLTKEYYRLRCAILENLINTMYTDGEALKDEIIRAAQEALQ